MRLDVFISVAILAIVRLVGYLTEPRLTDTEIHRIAGEPGDAGEADTPRPEHHPLRIVTWNIERGVRFDRIAAALDAMDADVILLQEVDRSCNRSGGRDVARELARRLQMHWISAGEFQEIGESRDGIPAVTGQAILSRSPITDAGVIVFKKQVRFRWRWNPVQPRRGGRIALKARSAGVLLYNLHIESGGDTALRRSQLAEVLADASHERTRPVVIGGDFNNAAKARPALLATLADGNFADALTNAVDRRTAIDLPHPIDWIFVRGASPRDGHVQQIAGASDHYPLFATLSPQH
jgi:endonuclease/exonuclease/phosphatase family metal-dependent hydrolase